MTARRYVFNGDVSPKQRAFLDLPSKFSLFTGGVGSGKTYAGALKALMMPAGSDGMVLAPTYPMLHDSTLKTFLEIALPAVVEYNKSRLQVKLADGKSISFRSADDPEHLRGPNLGWYWMDEAAIMTEATWDIMLGRLRRAPAVAWATTTPKGYNWLHRQFVTSGFEDYQLVTCSTRENPWLPEGYVHSLEEKYSSAFAQQEIEGVFCEMGGTRIKREWLRYGDPPAGLEIVCAFDLAISTKTESDYTACVVLGREATEGGFRWWVLDVQRVKVGFHGVLGFIASMSAKWQPRQVVVEQVAYQAAVVQELLRTTQLPVRGIRPDKDKVMRFQPVEARYEQGLVWHARGMHRDFEDELLSFPVGQHDDQVDALAYAYNALDTSGAGFLAFMATEMAKAKKTEAA